jgi:hypothetical protein
VHRAQFADLRVLAGGEAEFFQSLFEELSNVPLAVDGANATHDCSVVPEDGSCVSIADVPQQKKFSAIRRVNA